MSGRAWVELDLAAVRHNVTVARELAGVPLLAVVKANGYGHGAVDVARAALAAGAKGLGVATAEEALELRAAGITGSIQILGSFLPDELAGAVEARACLTLHEPEDLQRVRQAARRAGRPLPVQVIVDVGMARHGVPLEEALPLLEAASRDPGVHLTGLLTHLPCATAPDLSLTRARLARFRRLIASAAVSGVLPAQVHAAASAALFRLPEARLNQVRAGIALLGLDPAQCLGEPGARLRPALSLRAQVMRTRQVGKGVPVGYGGRWIAPRETTLALLGLGYGDGLPYPLTQQGAEVLIRGQRCPVVGSVMMDYTAVDVTDLDEVPAPGDVATIVGRCGEAEITLVEQAERAGLIPYAFSCGLGTRLDRVVLSESAPAFRRVA
ncbi:MAG: alanine racemase [Planctomycetes bacterium]|nr:alanine racemase [Planctomycetota bacterium]